MTIGEPDEARSVMASLGARGLPTCRSTATCSARLARLSRWPARLDERDWAEALLPLVEPHAGVVVVPATAAGSLRLGGALCRPARARDRTLRRGGRALRSRAGGERAHRRPAAARAHPSTTSRGRCGGATAPATPSAPRRSEADAARTAKQLGLVELGRRHGVGCRRAATAVAGAACRPAGSGGAAPARGATCGRSRAGRSSPA